MVTAIAEPREGTPERHHSDGDHDLPVRGNAQDIIGEMARLLGDARPDLLLGGGVLSAIAIGIAVEARFSPSALRPGAAGVAYVGLLACLVACWLRTVALMAFTDSQVFGVLSEFRWLTGAPLDTRAPWLSVPSVGDGEAEWSWTRAHLLLGAARARMERAHLALTWALVTAAFFLVWTAVIFL